MVATLCNLLPVVAAAMPRCKVSREAVRTNYNRVAPSVLQQRRGSFTSTAGIASGKGIEAPSVSAKGHRI